MITGNEPINPTDTYFDAENDRYCYSKNNADIEGKVYGLTIRQYFAAMAMAGWVQHAAAETYTGIAKGSVKMADALIAELNRIKDGGYDEIRNFKK